MERTAKKENRTMSELIRELYRRYVSDEARREFGRALENLRTEAARTPAGKSPCARSTQRLPLAAENEDVAPRDDTRRL